MSDPLVDYLRSCCLKVLGKRKGCGFFIAPQIIVTCAHVVGRELEKGAQVELEKWSERDIDTFMGEVIKISPDDDIAFLRTTKPSSTFAPLSAEVCIGNVLTALGFTEQGSREEFNQFTASYEGQTLFLDSSGRRGIEAKFKSGQVEPGYSGGPLLNLATGCVMGVVVATRHKQTDLGGWAIEVPVIERLLQESALVLPKLDLRWVEADAQQRKSIVSSRKVSHPIFLVTSNLGMPGEIQDLNSLAIEEALWEIESSGKTNFEIDYERDFYINRIVGYSRVLGAGLHNFMSIYREIQSLIDLKFLRDTLATEQLLSVEERYRLLDMRKLLELSKDLEERLSKFVLGFMRRCKELTHYYQQSKSLHETINNFLLLVIRSSEFRERKAKMDKGGDWLELSLTLDCWSIRPIKIDEVYFKVTLDAHEAESFLRMTGFSRKDDLRLLIYEDVRLSQLQDYTIVRKVYPKIMHRLFLRNIQISDCEAEILNLNYYKVGLA